MNRKKPILFEWQKTITRSSKPNPVPKHTFEKLAGLDYDRALAKQRKKVSALLRRKKKEVEDLADHLLHLILIQSTRKVIPHAYEVKRPCRD